MVQIVWTHQAHKNLEEIKAYVSQSSTFYAERLIKQFFESVQMLALHPEAGKIVQEQNQTVLRRLIVKSYRILYLYRSDVVKIVAIYHQSRQHADPFYLDELTE